MTAILSDAFNRADSASTLGSADVGGAWTVGNNGDGATLPTWGITSNRGVLLGGGTNGDRHAWLEASVADGALQVAVITANPVNAAQGGILFRRVDGSNFWTARVQNNTSTVDLRRIVAGAATTVSNVSVPTIAAGQTVLLEVWLAGTSIIVLVDGVPYITTTSSVHQTGTKHGITKSASSGGLRFDDFRLNPFIQVTGIASAAAVGTPTVTIGNITLHPDGIASVATVGAVTVTPLPFSVSPMGIASVAVVGTPSVLLVALLSPAGIASVAAVGVPTITFGAVTIHPSGIPSSMHVGAVSLVIFALLPGVGTLVATEAALGALVAAATSLGSVAASEATVGRLTATVVPLAA